MSKRKVKESPWEKQTRSDGYEYLLFLFISK